MTEQVESLWGKLDLSEMGIRASRETAPINKAKTSNKANMARDAKSAVEYVTAVVATALDDQPSAVIDSAVEDVIRVFKNTQTSEYDKRRQLNELLQIVIDDDRFIQLANLIAKMGNSSFDAQTRTDGDTVAIEFEESEDDDGLIGVIEEVEDEEDNEPVMVNEAEEGVNGRKKINLEALAFPLGSHTMTNEKCVLPEETKRIQMPGYEQVHVPAPKPFTFDDEELRSIDSLPPFYHRAFESIKRLNYIQSRVAEAVISTDHNVLLCAPTGAGKTNVALLSIVKEMSKFEGRLDQFKAVYIAPMKALVQEMVRTFTDRLSPYGINVAELTGDAQSTPQELGQAQLIIATPEKWDVVSRKANDLSYTRMVRLVIIDEIHLLHDERGPVLESIVMRLLADQRMTGEYLRIVGLSATLPNYIDVAKFIEATPSSTFMFDGGHRPVPLEQIFIGLTEKKPLKRVQVMNDVCYRMCVERVSRPDSTQTLVFVHSRKDTVKTAKMIVERAIVEKTIGKFVSNTDYDDLEVQSVELKQLVKYNVGVHHAGLSRHDRLLVERWFAEGRLRVLVSTATLAWGVNLPAHTVIIKGTQVYRPDRSEWCQLSGQDVLQMLGRAGRPQYDTVGEGIIITEHAELPFYMSLSTMQLPIESQLVSRLADHLNAAVCYGLVSGLQEAVQWLGKSYMAVRMAQSPKNYGCRESVVETMEDVCHSALCQLAKARLIEYDRQFYTVSSTELGKIASDYYLPCSTAATFMEHLSSGICSEVDLLRVFSLSAEFKTMAVRREEHFEIAKLIEKVPIPVRESSQDRLAKVNVLLQSYISQWPLAGYALQADTLYVTQSAARLFRAMFAVALSCKQYKTCRTILELCKSVDRRQWFVLSPLRQTDLPLDVVMRVERREFPFERLFDLGTEELGDLVRMPAAGKDIYTALQSFPRIKVSADCYPLSRDYLHVELTIEPLWRRTDDQNEQFWIFIQDPNRPGGLLCHDTVLFRAGRSRTTCKTLRCPMTRSPVIYIDVVSDKWIGAQVRLPVALINMTCPEETLPLMSLRDVKLREGLDVIESNVIQAVEQVFMDGKSAFVCAPTELTRVIRMAIDGDKRVLWLHPCEKFVKCICELAPKCYVLTGDALSDWKAMEEHNMVIGSCKSFEVISRKWKNKKAFESLNVIIVQDVHFINTLDHMDILLSRLKMLKSAHGFRFAILACSQPINTAREFSEWLLGSEAVCLPFDLECRPLDIHIISMPQQHLPSLVLAGTRRCLDKSSRVVVFVEDYRQAKQTALDLSALKSTDCDVPIDVHDDKVLKETLPKGVVYLHEEMPSDLKNNILEAVERGDIMHVAMSRESIWSVSCNQLSFDHVVILGTGQFVPQRNAVVEYQQHEIVRMMQFANKSVMIITMKSREYLYHRMRPLVCESGLRTADLLSDHLNSAIANRSVQNRQDAVDLLTWTWMYRRLIDNPNYYGMIEEEGLEKSISISSHLSELVEDAVSQLVETGSITEHLSCTNLGLIAAHHGVSPRTIDMFALSLKKGSRVKAVLELIVQSVEFDDMTVRYREDHLLCQLADAMNITYKYCDDPHEKTLILLHAHFSRLSLTSTLSSDQQYIVMTAYRLAMAMFDVACSLGWLTPACSAAECCQMLVMAMWDYEHPMRSIPGVSSDMIKELESMKIMNVYDFVDLEDDNLKAAFLERSGAKRLAIRAINRYPSISCSARLDPEHGVEVCIEADVDVSDIIAPLFPSSKREQWWVVAASGEDEVVAVKRVSLIDERTQFLLDVPTGTPVDRVLLLSDSFIGCDQQLIVK